MRIILVLLLICAVSLTHAQPEPYEIFNAKGKKVSYRKMLHRLEDQQVILFGELHNNAIAHWLQVEVTKDLASRRNIVQGAEMFEADNQEAIDKYLKKEIDQKGLDTLARLWPNHKTDYAPLLDLAKENDRKFIATNVPRRYANRVYRYGFKTLDSLPEEEKSWIAPLPIAFDPDLPTYQNILKMMGDHGSEKLVMAQAIKDATMAHFILENIESDKVFIHYNGAYHSDFYEGILWYLNRENPDLKFSTISTVVQEELSSLEDEHLGKADFIIVVDSDMTNTY
ncbi:ChaN family lipoprotein [Robertkochia aurantiaca]|uniref:ChaN family lipoprotein n=1 Tax=Robertkochia aurantiaca TaxID=2873700 RepID=UPI001CCC904B|nr:ChaN family lipoprotein [Robertkochia sp. 3YJGBD-33]